MPRAPRIQFNGAFYHVYNRGVDKQSIYRDEAGRRKFIYLLGNTVKTFGLELYAYCLMTNHFHLFLQTPSGNLDQAMWSLSGRYAQYVNLRHGRVGPLFQGRYKSKLVDTDAYSLSLMRYIHQNPFQAKIVRHLEEYAWSSYAGYAGKLKTPWLNTKWILDQFDRDTKKALPIFLRFHETIPSAEEKKKLERFGAVLGDGQFRAGVKKLKKAKRGLAPF